MAVWRTNVYVGYHLPNRKHVIATESLRGARYNSSSYYDDAVYHRTLADSHWRHKTGFKLSIAFRRVNFTPLHQNASEHAISIFETEKFFSFFLLLLLLLFFLFLLPCILVNKDVYINVSGEKDLPS